MFASIGLVVGFGRSLLPPETDTYWSARYGLDLVSSGRFPRADTYSWTASGHQWVPNSWGWDVLLGLTYRAVGMMGFGLIVVLLSVGIGLTVAWAARGLGAAPFHAAIVFTAFAPVMVVPYARAETLSCLVVLVIPGLVRRLMDATGLDVVKFGGGLVAMQLAWVNVHSAAFIGPALIGAGGLAVVVRTTIARRALVVRLVTVVVATGLACLATPYGLTAVSHLPEVRRASVGLISEWDHPGLGTVAQIVGLIAVGMALAASISAWRCGRPAITGVLLVLGAGTMSAIRFAPMVLVVATPVLGAALSRANVRPKMARRILALGLVIVAIFVSNGLRTFGRTERVSSSPSLVADLPRGCRVVNDYEVGAAIILFGNANLVSIDGRNDMYGRARVLDALGMLANKPGTIARLDANRVDCVLAQPSWPLVRALATDPAWRVDGSDGARVLLVRKGSP